MNEEIDENLLNEVLNQIGDDLIHNEEKFREIYSNSQEKCENLSSKSKQLEKQINDSKINQENFVQHKDTEIDALNLQIKNVSKELKEPFEILTNFFKENPKNTQTYQNYALYEKVYHLAKELTENEGNHENYEEYSSILQQKTNEFLKDIKDTVYKGIEHYISIFSVSTHNALKQIFFSKDTPQAKMGNEFLNLIDSITFSNQWQETVCEIACKIFNNRMLFHIERTKYEKESTYASFLLGLLRNTLQTSSFIFSPIEKYSPDKPLMPIFTKMIYKSTISTMKETIASHSTNLLRHLFIESNLFDEWIESIDFILIDFTFSTMLFEELGQIWMKQEFESFKFSFSAELDKVKGNFDKCENQVPSIALHITTILSKLFNSIPRSLTNDQFQLFIKNCIVLCQTYSVKQLFSLYDYEECIQSCIIINSIYVIVTQMKEFYELTDCSCGILLNEAQKFQKQYEDNCVEMARYTYQYFEGAASQYFINGDLKYNKGLVSYDLASGIEEISEYFNTTKRFLNEYLFEMFYLPTLEHSIDNQITKMVVSRAHFERKDVREQFSIDVDTLVSVYGGSDLRKIRSARMIITQREEKYLDCEISDSEIERLLSLTNKANE